MAELHPDTARDTARNALSFLQYFNGQKWDSIFDNQDRRNLAIALDYLQDLAAMTLNLSGRVTQLESSAPSSSAVPRNQSDRPEQNYEGQETVLPNAGSGSQQRREARSVLEALQSPSSEKQASKKICGNCGMEEPCSCWYELGPYGSASGTAEPESETPLVRVVDLEIHSIPNIQPPGMQHNYQPPAKQLKRALAMAMETLEEAIGDEYADRRCLSRHPTWQMKEAGGEAYLQSRELEGKNTGLTSMDMAEEIYMEMFKAAQSSEWLRSRIAEITAAKEGKR